MDAEAIRDRRVKIESLTRNAAAFFRTKHTHRTHVVQPVGELHEDHAEVFGHRDGHLLEILGLRFRA